MVTPLVALLAEGVDRNNERAEDGRRLRVALLAEGVDRNREPPSSVARLDRRPPRGGRG